MTEEEYNMKTLREKLPRIPSPIREMIVENIKSNPHNDQDKDKWLKKCLDTEETIFCCIVFAEAEHLPDHDFWSAINEEILLMK